MNLRFGENLKRIRREKNLTQEKLAEILDVSCQSVSRWELGICYPDVELLPSIANYFGVSIDTLLMNDENSKETIRNEFVDKLQNYPFENEEEKIKFIEEYHRMYPDNASYTYELLYHTVYYVIKDDEKRKAAMPKLLSLADNLIDTNHRNAVVNLMVSVVDDAEEFSKWINKAPYRLHFTRRGCLVTRAKNRGDTKEFYHQQGIAAFENLSTILDTRFPDALGPERKAEFCRDIMRIIESFGENGEIPDAWKCFYAKKQLVLSACLFGAGRYEEGWSEFDSAMEKYKYVHSVNLEWLELGNGIFSGVKVDKRWENATSTDGEKYTLYLSKYLSNYNTSELADFLSSPRWAWFNSVRDTEKYRDAIKWAHDNRDTEE